MSGHRTCTWHVVALSCLVAFVLPTTVEPMRLQAAKFAIGGASSFEALGPALLKGPCKRVAGRSKYQAVGSTAGIDNFNKGTYVVALSDNPMTSVQESTGISANPGKLTIPLLIAKHAFFVSGAADGAVKLTAAESYSIFKSGGKSFLPVSRSDNSGSTFVVKQYWKAAGTGFAKDIAADVSLYSTAPFPKSWRASKYTGKGAEGVCQRAVQLRGSITYGQVGVCNTIAAGVTGEVLLPNKAGIWTLASQSDPAQAIPRTLPKLTEPWSAISERLILQSGPKTPPMVSFIYAFIRKTGLPAAGSNGALGKSLLLCIINNINSLAETYQFSTLPANITRANIVAINGIK